ncbi:MAG: DEAD/DEAH box helicase family protein, partial [Desulfobacterales bacterium]
MTSGQDHRDYIEVAIPLPVHNTYHYAVDITHFPGELTGRRVMVPFGQRQVTGYVLGPCSIAEPKAIKTILDVLDEKPLFPASMMPFFRWIADYYIHPIGEVIKGAVPQGLNQRDFLTVAITVEGQKALAKAQHPLTPLEAKILTKLGPTPCQLKSLYRKTKIDFPMSLIHNMEREGLIVVRQEIKAGRTKPKMERYVSILDRSIPLDNRSKTKRKIMDALEEQGEIPVRQLKALLPTAPGLLKPMAKVGLVALSEKRVYRDPFGEPIAEDEAHNLTREQTRVVDTIEASIGKGSKTYLLAGVTGSGKTEVYMQLAERTIRRGRSVLVLVPEIALISQIEKRFRARFGECVALLHSGLSAGERYDQWMRIVNHEVSIAISARSAIFAPFDNIGLLIVDEEHDGSYKQEGGLRYNARDLATVRARHDSSIALLGSATPSIQSYYNVKAKKYQ